MQKVKYATTTIQLPFNGELPTPDVHRNWQLKETHIVDTSHYENQSQGMTVTGASGAPSVLINTCRSKTHSLQCVWFSIIEEKEGTGWE